MKNNDNDFLSSMLAKGFLGEENNDPFFNDIPNSDVQPFFEDTEKQINVDRKMNQQDATKIQNISIEKKEKNVRNFQKNDGLPILANHQGDEILKLTDLLLPENAKETEKLQRAIKKILLKERNKNTKKLTKKMKENEANQNQQELSFLPTDEKINAIKNKLLKLQSSYRENPLRQPRDDIEMLINPKYKIPIKLKESNFKISDTGKNDDLDAYEPLSIRFKRLRSENPSIYKFDSCLIYPWWKNALYEGMLSSKSNTWEIEREGGGETDEIIVNKTKKRECSNSLIPIKDETLSDQFNNFNLKELTISQNEENKSFSLKVNKKNHGYYWGGETFNIKKEYQNEQLFNISKSRGNENLFSIVDGKNFEFKNKLEEEKLKRSIIKNSFLNHEVMEGLWVDSLFIPSISSEKNAKRKLEEYEKILERDSGYPLRYVQADVIDDEDKIDYLYFSTNQQKENNDFVTELDPKAVEHLDQNKENEKKYLKSHIRKIAHSIVAERLKYNKIRWDDDSLELFHKPKINIEQLIIRKIQAKSKGISEGLEWNPYIVKESDEGIIFDEENLGIANPHELMKNRFKLSIKDGEFILCEHIDQYPYFANNFGMASKLISYVYPDDGTKKFDHVWQKGVKIDLQPKDKIPLLGQIDQSVYKGISVIENNMYVAPAVFTKPPEIFFVIIKHRSNSGNYSYYLRKLSNLCTIGQEEPKMEIYNPQSKIFNQFVRDRAIFLLQILFAKNMNVMEFNKIWKEFNEFNEQGFKKILKDMNVTEDQNHTIEFNEQNKMTFSKIPENVCRWESAKFFLHKLQQLGIKNLVNSDKISFATSKLVGDVEYLKPIAKFIEEEILCTPWNITQNFLSCKETKGSLLLRGMGDPSNGMGGYSFLKIPQKAAAIDPRKRVVNSSGEPVSSRVVSSSNLTLSGSDADLRKLNKNVLKRHLVELGYKEDDIDKMSRWKCVHLLRKHSTQANTMGMENSKLRKFARVKNTQDMQKKSYQDKINKIFKMQMDLLILPYSKVDMIDKHADIINQRKLALKQKASINKEKPNEDNKKQLTISFDGPHDAKSIDELPNLDVSEDKATNGIIEILKKTAKIYDAKAKKYIIKTIYTSDIRNVKYYQKKLNRKDNTNFKKGNSELSFNDENSKGNMDHKKNNKKKKKPHQGGFISTKVELNLARIAKSNEQIKAEQEEDFLKPKANTSKRRQNKPDSLFNEAIRDIIDKCIVFDHSKQFHNPVKKKDAPDYYQKITNPIDLNTMKNKCRRYEYSNIQSFFDDLELMKNNSIQYNGEVHPVTQQAKKILVFAKERIEENQQLSILEKHLQTISEDS